MEASDRMMENTWPSLGKEIPDLYTPVIFSAGSSFRHFIYRKDQAKMFYGDISG